MEEVDLLKFNPDKRQNEELIPPSLPDHMNQETWRPLFDPVNQSDEEINKWQVQGSWYAVGDILVANPWKASMVRRDLAAKNYLFRVKGRRVSGRDGFVVLFMCGSQSCAWVLGGWNNTRSEVAGLYKTQRDIQINFSDWYEVIVEVLADTVSGYLNGETIWQIPRAEIENAKLPREFLDGIGMATWSSMVKFKEPFFVDKSMSEKDGDNEPTIP